MNKISLKNKLFFSLFLLVGVASLAYSGYSIWNEYQFSQISVKAPGQVVDYVTKGTGDDTYYYPIFHYKTKEGDSIEQESKTGYGNKKFKVYEKIDLLYNPNNPQDIRIDTFWDIWFPSIITALIGLSFILSIYMILRHDYINPKRRKKLMSTGRKLEAQITRIMESESTNKRTTGWRIYTKFKEGKKTHIFISPTLYFNPKPIIVGLDITNITVWVDPNNMKKYWMDVDKIINNKKNFPNQAGENPTI